MPRASYPMKITLVTPAEFRKLEYSRRQTHFLSRGKKGCWMVSLLDPSCKVRTVYPLEASGLEEALEAVREMERRYTSGEHDKPGKGAGKGPRKGN